MGKRLQVIARFHPSCSAQAVPIEGLVDAAVAPDASQLEAWTLVGKPLVDSCIHRRRSGTLIAYGGWGSGKSYSMGVLDVGQLSPSAADAGILTRSVDAIFQALSHTDVSISAVEVVGEDVVDLLRSPAAASRPMAAPGSSPGAPGSAGSSPGAASSAPPTVVVVTAVYQAMAVLRRAVMRRLVAPGAEGRQGSSIGHLVIQISWDGRHAAASPATSSSPSPSRGTRRDTSESGASSSSPRVPHSAAHTQRCTLTLVDLSAPALLLLPPALAQPARKGMLSLGKALSAAASGGGEGAMALREARLTRLLAGSLDEMVLLACVSGLNTNTLQARAVLSGGPAAAAATAAQAASDEATLSLLKQLAVGRPRPRSMRSLSHTYASITEGGNQSLASSRIASLPTSPGILPGVWYPTAVPRAHTIASHGISSLRGSLAGPESLLTPRTSGSPGPETSSPGGPFTSPPVLYSPAAAGMSAGGGPTSPPPSGTRGALRSGLPQSSPCHAAGATLLGNYAAFNPSMASFQAPTSLLSPSFSLSRIPRARPAPVAPPNGAAIAAAAGSPGGARYSSSTYDILNATRGVLSPQAYPISPGSITSTSTTCPPSPSPGPVSPGPSTSQYGPFTSQQQQLPSSFPDSLPNSPPSGVDHTGGMQWAGAPLPRLDRLPPVPSVNASMTSQLASGQLAADTEVAASSPQPPPQGASEVRKSQTDSRSYAQAARGLPAGSAPAGPKSGLHRSLGAGTGAVVGGGQPGARSAAAAIPVPGAPSLAPRIARGALNGPGLPGTPDKYVQAAARLWPGTRPEARARPSAVPANSAAGPKGADPAGRAQGSSGGGSTGAGAGASVVQSGSAMRTHSRSEVPDYLTHARRSRSALPSMAKPRYRQGATESASGGVRPGRSSGSGLSRKSSRDVEEQVDEEEDSSILKGPGRIALEAQYAELFRDFTSFISKPSGSRAGSAERSSRMGGDAIGRTSVGASRLQRLSQDRLEASTPNVASTGTGPLRARKPPLPLTQPADSNPTVNDVAGGSHGTSVGHAAGQLVSPRSPQSAMGSRSASAPPKSLISRGVASGSSDVLTGQDAHAAAYPKVLARSSTVREGSSRLPKPPGAAGLPSTAPLQRTSSRAGADAEHGAGPAAGGRAKAQGAHGEVMSVPVLGRLPSLIRQGFLDEISEKGAGLAEEEDPMDDDPFMAFPSVPRTSAGALLGPAMGLHTLEVLINTPRQAQATAGARAHVAVDGAAVGVLPPVAATQGQAQARPRHARVVLSRCNVAAGGGGTNSAGPAGRALPVPRIPSLTSVPRVGSAGFMSARGAPATSGSRIPELGSQSSRKAPVGPAAVKLPHAPLQVASTGGTLYTSALASSSSQMAGTATAKAQAMAPAAARRAAVTAAAAAASRTAAAAARARMAPAPSTLPRTRHSSSTAASASYGVGGGASGSASLLPPATHSTRSTAIANLYSLQRIHHAANAAAHQQRAGAIAPQRPTQRAARPRAARPNGTSGGGPPMPQPSPSPPATPTLSHRSSASALSELPGTSLLLGPTAAQSVLSGGSDASPSLDAGLSPDVRLLPLPSFMRKPDAAFNRSSLDPFLSSTESGLAGYRPTGQVWQTGREQTPGAAAGGDPDPDLDLDLDLMPPLPHSASVDPPSAPSCVDDADPAAHLGHMEGSEGAGLFGTPLPRMPPVTRSVPIGTGNAVGTKTPAAAGSSSVGSSGVGGGGSRLPVPEPPGTGPAAGAAAPRHQGVKGGPSASGGVRGSEGAGVSSHLPGSMQVSPSREDLSLLELSLQKGQAAGAPSTGNSPLRSTMLSSPLKARLGAGTSPLPKASTLRISSASGSPPVAHAAAGSGTSHGSHNSTASGRSTGTAAVAGDAAQHTAAQYAGDSHVRAAAAMYATPPVVSPPCGGASSRIPGHPQAPEQAPPPTRLLDEDADVELWEADTGRSSPARHLGQGPHSPRVMSPTAGSTGSAHGSTTCRTTLPVGAAAGVQQGAPAMLQQGLPVASTRTTEASTGGMSTRGMSLGGMPIAGGAGRMLGAGAGAEHSQEGEMNSPASPHGCIASWTHRGTAAGSQRSTTGSQRSTVTSMGGAATAGWASSPASAAAAAVGGAAAAAAGVDTHSHGHGHTVVKEISSFFEKIGRTLSKRSHIGH